MLFSKKNASHQEVIHHSHRLNMDHQIKVDLAVLVEIKAVTQAVEVSDNNQAINMDHLDLQEEVADLDNKVLCLIICFRLISNFN